MDWISILSTIIPTIIGSFIGYLQGKKKDNADLMSKYQQMYDVFVEDNRKQYVDMKKYFERKIQYLEQALEECKKSHK